MLTRRVDGQARQVTPLALPARWRVVLLPLAVVAAVAAGWALVDPGGTSVAAAALLAAAGSAGLAVVDRRRLASNVAVSTRERDELASVVQAVFANGPVGMAVIDLRDDQRGRFLVVNPQLATFLQRTVAECEMLRCADITPAGDDVTDLGEDLLAVAERSGRTRVAVERPLLRADGTTVWGLLSGMVMTDHLGQPDTLVLQVQDIDRRRQLQHDLHRHTAFIEAVVTDVEVGLLACDASGRVTLFNPAAWTQFSGQDDVTTMPDTWPRDLWPRHADGRPLQLEELPLQRALAGEELVNEEFTLTRADGDLRTHLTSARRMLDEDGSVLGAVVTVNDITDRKRDEDEMARMATSDHLTGLPNRRLLNARLGQALDRAEGGRSHVALLFLDLDRFKLINDSRGHDVGDRLLQCIADRLQDGLRPGDTVARMGGDEFVVLCDGVLGELEALAIADRVCRDVSQPMVVGDDEVVITCSVGVVLAGQDAVPHDLLRRADLAMYAAKDAGRDSVSMYRHGLTTAVSRRFHLERRLRTALRDDELVVQYQPIVDAVAGDTVAVEALVRWQRDHQLLMPAEFIDVAEDSGLIVDIDRLVLSTACRTAADMDDELTVNVNLSSRQLADRDLVSFVVSMLDVSGLPPERLCLELTERALIDAGAGVDEALQVLRRRGVRVALDDFGTGYASLTYLRRFAVDVVKIDHSFVRGMLTSRDDRAIVAATIDLAHELGLSTVAEGVETPEQGQVLTDMGCDRLQGFWYSRAVHSADLPRRPVA